MSKKQVSIDDRLFSIEKNEIHHERKQPYDDAYPWKAEKSGHQGQHRATGSTSSEVQTIARFNKFDLIIK